MQIKINDYQSTTISMETKSQQAPIEIQPHKNTKSYIKETLWYKGKNHKAASKIFTMKIDIITLKFMPNFSSQ